VLLLSRPFSVFFFVPVTPSKVFERTSPFFCSPPPKVPMLCGCRVIILVFPALKRFFSRFPITSCFPSFYLFREIKYFLFPYCRYSCKNWGIRSVSLSCKSPRPSSLFREIWRSKSSVVLFFLFRVGVQNVFPSFPPLCFIASEELFSCRQPKFS